MQLVYTVNTYQPLGLCIMGLTILNFLSRNQMFHVKHLCPLLHKPREGGFCRCICSLIKDLIIKDLASGLLGCEVSLCKMGTGKRYSHNECHFVCIGGLDV